MKTIKCSATLQENGKLILKDLPIAKGEKVKVTLTIVDEHDDQLEAMALDPNIQRQIKNIADEFAITENDGLEGV